MNLPKIPNKYFSHFVRGFFDGDGCIVYGNFFSKERQKMKQYIQSAFISANQNFLNELFISLKRLTDIEGGSLRYSGRGWRLSFSIYDTKRLFSYIYQNTYDGIRMMRKKNKFEEAINFYFNK